MLTVSHRSGKVIKDHCVLAAVKSCEAYLYVLLQKESQDTLRGEKSQEAEYSIKYAANVFLKQEMYMYIGLPVYKVTSLRIPKKLVRVCFWGWGTAA